jgi:hypothetical protein
MKMSKSKEKATPRLTAIPWRDEAGAAAGDEPARKTTTSGTALRRRRRVSPISSAVALCTVCWEINFYCYFHVGIVFLLGLFSGVRLDILYYFLCNMSI